MFFTILFDQSFTRTHRLSPGSAKTPHPLTQYSQVLKKCLLALAELELLARLRDVSICDVGGFLEALRIARM